MKISKLLGTGALVFLSSIVASQCFAKSQSNTSDADAIKQRQYIEVINQLYYYIQQNYVDDVDPQVLYEGALKGMLESLKDPYSVYMDKSAWRSLTDTTVGDFGGVGLVITKPVNNTEEEPAYVEVSEPIDDTPGAKAGIQSGDKIISIDGTDTSTITMDEVLSKLRGTVGESVNLTIRRKSVDFERTLVRALIENITVKHGIINGIGYIRITEFSTHTAARVQEALDSFKENKCKGIIIDLRNNGGGLLSAAVEIADKFIDEGPIVSTKSRRKYDCTVHNATEKNTAVRNTPVVVLINRASASASEILSGALKDTKKAYLVGEKTYGKGSVQVPSSLINKDGFKITIARYYTPTDENIDKVGIKPDLEVTHPEFTPEQEEAWKKLEKDDPIEKFVTSRDEISENDIAAFAEELYANYKLEKRFLRKLIRNRANRTKPSMLYDLDYDLQLNEAIKLIENTKDFNSLLENTKTVKEQKAEAESKAQDN